jgi:superfamily II DNA or RNA helicase
MARGNGRDLPSRTSDLLAAIARDEAELSRLEREQAEARKRLAALRSEVANVDARAPSGQRLPMVSSAAPTPADKVKLFRSLFLGREDVFPTRFVSKKTGNPGYAPACSNKFVDGVCGLKRGVKCGDCSNQAFLPVDDAAVVGHLTGRHVMGVYPLLDDETCWFLAVDFDKSEWQKDVAAFAETCARAGVPAAVERSRSGNGAHAWFFFSGPVAASTARKMGCHLLTETMARRHELSMKSYDRLFPSQDTMPRGGFGNLIALPLQHGPRQQGNSLFVDERFAPFPGDEQWAYLASVSRVEPARVEAIAQEATRRGTVIGVRLADSGGDDLDGASPWMRLPSGNARPVRIAEPLPKDVRALLAQRLFVEKAGLPSVLVNQVKRLAAFQNPEFYRKQSMRLSTATTPRVIACAEDLPQHVALPRGCRSDLEGLLRQHGVALLVDDQRRAGVPVDYRFRGQLTPMQEQAGRALLAHDTGVFVAPPGVGKTVVGTYLVAARACSTLVLVHRQPLLEQWITQLSLFLGIEPKEIGQIGAGKRKPNGKLDVAMIQSLVRQGSVEDLVAGYGHVIVDECHHLPAVSFERVLAEAKARYVVGLTATPHRRDGHHPITQMQLGPVRFAVDPRSHAAQRPFEHRLIVRETDFKGLDAEKAPSIQEHYAALASDETRNRMVLNDVVGALEAGRSPILLTERRDHLEFFAERLRAFARHLVILQGGMSAKERREVSAQLAAIPADQERLILATGRYIGEGFDDARLDTLFLALPVSWKGTLVQYAGRLHRLHAGKTEVRIYDYVDREVPMLLRMFEKRLRSYRAIGYARGEAPLGFAEPTADRVIEYDEDVIRELEHLDEFA